MLGKKWFIAGIAILLSLHVMAGEFSKVASGEPELLQKGDSKPWCPVCGMNLKMFYKTSHGVHLHDGSSKQYCSIRCLAVDWATTENKVAKLLVTDVNSEKLIDASQAFYVVGSNIPGTMSMVSKLAFSTEEDAKAFAKEHGGEVVRFDAAFAKAKGSLKDDVEAFIKKKQKGMYPMGEKIYTQACQPNTIHADEFKTISELKAALKKTKLCGELEEKELQAVGLYIWEVLGKDTHQHSAKGLHVKEDEKCPVCGMFVSKYPRWAARLRYQEADKKVDLAFDGVKDLLKFYQNPAKWGAYTQQKYDALTILVTDYYTQEVIDAKSAFYVMGSDVYGPMGKEFIPFSTLKAAQTFKHDHKGKHILEFSKITQAHIEAQDK